MRGVCVVAPDAHGVASRPRRVQNIEIVCAHDEGCVGREGQVLSERGLLVDIVPVREQWFVSSDIILIALRCRGAMENDGTHTRPCVGSAIAWWVKPVRKSSPTNLSFRLYVAPRADETRAETVNSAAVERMVHIVKEVGGRFR